MEVTKDILIQYCELREEIKDLRERIDRDEQMKELKKQAKELGSWLWKKNWKQQKKLR